MTRREAIRRTSFLLGGTLSASAVLGVMSGCKADPELNWTPAYFTLEEGDILEQMIDRIIPATETPGAVEAGVPAFIDKMMAEFYPAETSEAFRTAIVQADEDARAEHDKSFTALDPAQQDALLTRYDREAFSSVGQPHFFRTLKELTILGFCTSELGATTFLEYDPVPGDYKGCIPYEEVGKAWAT